MNRSVEYYFGDGKNNNFDAVRLIAATMVIFDHSFPLTGNSDPLVKYIYYGNIGNVAVAVFFSISGFLVTRSIEQNSIANYTAARVLRIFPALFCALLFDALIIGPLFTQYDLARYFDDWRFKAHLETFFLFTFNTALPGVFENNPYPNWVNGSLWSLPYEFMLYLILPIVFVCKGLDRRLNWILAAAAVAGFVLSQSGAIGLTYKQQGTPIFGSVYPFLVLEFGSFFVIGSSIWIYKDRIPLSFAGVFVLFALSWAGAGLVGGYFFYCILIPYATIWFSLSLPRVKLEKAFGDISYGIYIYAFPIQQSIVYVFGCTVSAWLVTVITIPITFILAYLSHRFIELPVMNLRFKLLKNNDLNPSNWTRFG